MSLSWMFLILLHTFSGILSRHVFVSFPQKWTDAQELCRANYTDLSPVTSQKDARRLHRAYPWDFERPRSWLGLYRSPPNSSVWRWSGGGMAGVYQNWAFHEPNDWSGEGVAAETYSNGKWNDIKESHKKPFYCIHLLVVNETAAWEEALEHCRQNKGHLLSMPSDTRHLLALRDLQKTNTTQSVWIGLRYLSRRWLWVNGDPVGFQGWSLAGGNPDNATGATNDPPHHLQSPRCPVLNGWGCGAMTREGVWEARNCQEKLSFICD
ncbi:hypothetical protein NHX12_017910 [Muraenolepis orangiensis]|uniref:C-type lectin domain-containing protein n=1 Tax=Muraenolepis orangiensis TaxID=630683 RepID=A0A9Q0IYF8_9TELE|nr:hypothetical protein NHX12_017910 [Muraenolepis orangiensis]